MSRLRLHHPHHPIRSHPWNPDPRKRQVGSNIKPFVYSAALEHGYHPLAEDGVKRVLDPNGLMNPGKLFDAQG